MIPFDVSDELLRRSYAKTKANLQHNLATQYAALDAHTLGYIVATDLQIAMAEGIPNPEFRRELVEGIREGMMAAVQEPLAEDSLPEYLHEAYK